MNRFNLFRMFRQRSGELQEDVLQGKGIDEEAVVMQTDHQSIDESLNDQQKTADEAKQKTMHKMVHDIRIV